jgi:hypothetical protein
VTPIDPQAMHRGMANAYQLQGAQQQQQLNQLKLDEAQREEFERQNLGAALRGTMTTDPVTGSKTPNMPGALSRAYQTSRDPLALLKVETAYGTSQAESRKSVLEAQKIRLEGLQKQTEFVSGIAQGALQAVQQGADPQVVWQRAVSQVAQAGLPTQNLPPTYDAGLLQQYAMSTLKSGEALQAQQKVVDQQLREYELAETQKRTGLQREELDVKRADIGERRAEREQTRETAGASRTFDQENKLRDEYQAQNKNYREVRDAWGRIETTGAATAPTVANDYALIYSFMKMLDPMTGIRDAETRNAVEAGGLPAQTQRWVEWVQGNKILPDNIRSQFVETGKRLYDQYTRENAASQAYYTDLAKQYGLRPERVIQDLRATPVPRAAGAPGTGRTAGRTGAPLPTTVEEIDRELADIERQLGGR